MTRRFLLDTNIISDAQRPEPDPLLAAWMEGQADAALFTAAVVLGEVWQGILQKEEGRTRRALVAWFEGPSGPPGLFAGRVLPLDERAALLWAELVADGRRFGQPRNAIDTQIAAMAQVNACALVTRNAKHFAPVGDRLEVVDPTSP